jgi:hypothetical protein
MESGGHDVVRVACQNGNVVPGGAVPYADRLIV